ncbi:hypothetical protein POM88_023883 [Heracleum sosnowskyi]|uniref:Uncharacterized protein n=1 Tax=Heracleum sosnowskyi TaxID=360622 RepID=A0AAD8MWD9_9APIA|nr:hypothetical protein POM88_023883 [Heracleum sosnowskyi]
MALSGTIDHTEGHPCKKSWLVSLYNKVLVGTPGCLLNVGLQILSSSNPYDNLNLFSTIDIHQIKLHGRSSLKGTPTRKDEGPELLSEPETPVSRGHPRSSSDSFAYVDAANAANLDYVAHDEYRSRNMSSLYSWKSQDLDYYKDAHNASAEPNSFRKYKNRAWNSPSNVMAHPSGLLPAKDLHQSFVST